MDPSDPKAEVCTPDKSGLLSTPKGGHPDMTTPYGRKHSWGKSYSNLSQFVAGSKASDVLQDGD
jgi:hypothetical protein